jgi:DNA helicase HerA-like ATPase
VCIDITNEHGKTLSNYLDESLIQLDFVQDKLTALKTSSQKTGARDKPAEWGNTTEYATSLQALLKEFGESDKRVLVLNPDLHAVTKALSQFNITELAELTVAQKTRIISERVFLKAKDGWQADDSKQEAKYLIVYEEAHSLIPEWNSSANDGDQQASNGTAKVIMQGRKYGLGSLVITQRTANISKSILNQCNTIFALRVFDDTGKTFLENYVGSDYANALPILEERHAVVVGKALSLKQPVILQLNNRDKVLKKPAQPKKGKR